MTSRRRSERAFREARWTLLAKEAYERSDERRERAEDNAALTPSERRYRQRWARILYRSDRTTCVGCGRRPSRSRSWVVGRYGACCRSCYFLCVLGHTLPRSLQMSAERQREMRSARRHSGVSQQRLADLMSVNRSRLSHLEGARALTRVTSETALNWIDALEALGATLPAWARRWRDFVRRGCST